MFKLYNIPNPSSPRSLLNYSWDNFNLRLEENVERVNDYYSMNSHFTLSNHILISLLHNLGVSLSEDEFSFERKVLFESIYSCNILGLTSNTNVGKVHHGQFYKGDKELILVTNHPNAKSIVTKETWRNIVSVRYLRHNRTQLDYHLLNGQVNGKGGVSVIHVDVGLLAWQYRRFLEEEQVKSYFSSESKDVNYFLSTVILNNMIYSCIGSTVINNFRKHINHENYTERLIDNPVNKPMVMVNSLQGDLESLSMRTCESLKKHDLFIKDVLCNIPLIDRENAYGFSQLPEDRLHRQQNLWLYVYTTLPFIRLGMGLNNNSYNKNATWRESFVRFIKQNNITSSFYQSRLLSVSDEMNEELESTLEYFKA